MRSFAIVTLGLVLGACPKKAPDGPKPAAGVGCPAASDVFVASYLAPEEGAKGQGHTGWVLPLHDKTVDTLDGVAEYATIDAAAAQAAGVPAPPQNLWLMLPQKAGGMAPPCRVTYGSYYAAAIDAPTKNIAYGIELSGCNPPADANLELAIALASAEPPGQCAIVAPKLAGGRFGEVDKDGKWSRPTKETAIPPAIAALVPPRECAAPTCEKLWSIGQVDLGGKPLAWAGVVNWLAIPDGAKPEQQCEWKAETWSGFFVAGGDGAPVAVTEGQDHPLSLFAVLVDGGGAKAMLATGPGEYTSYAYANGAVTVGRHLVWLRPHPDSYEEATHLGPECP